MCNCENISEKHLDFYYENDLPIIGKEIDDFEFDVYQNEEINKVKLSDYRGKWVVLFFYPADFTFVCPTEFEEFAKYYNKFKDLDTEIISMSTDTAYVHKAWHDHSSAVSKVEFPMGADPTGNISRSFGVYIPEEGLALRGTFIINPDGELVSYEVNDNSIGRNVEEILRKLQAAQFVRKYGDKVCPAGWHPGDEALTPGVDLIGKI